MPIEKPGRSEDRPGRIWRSGVGGRGRFLSRLGRLSHLYQLLLAVLQIVGHGREVDSDQLPRPARLFELVQTLWGSIETEWDSRPVTERELAGE